MLKEIPGSITAPKGFKAAGVKAGIKKSGKEDIALIVSDVPATAAATFTLNTMAAAPVAVSKEVAAKGQAKAIVVNAGCANACTGEQGLADARAMAAEAAKALNVDASEVFVASTGVIGVELPMDKVKQGIVKAAAELSVDGEKNAGKAIMTTDTFSKAIAVELELGGKTVRIGGVAKGSGMIHPNMATMLAFITTDAAISQPVLQQALAYCIQVSFNMISVDGDTSTNDMVAVLANGLAGNEVVDRVDTEDYMTFLTALHAVCVFLAKAIARDGEGATKFLEVQVKGAISFYEAKKAAMTIAKSPLVKTAFFGQDPNWGRIVSAVGYSETNINAEKLAVWLGAEQVVKGGMKADTDEEVLQKVMQQHDIVVTVDLGVGSAEATVWTCDFSYEYVKINGEYHT